MFTAAEPVTESEVTLSAKIIDGIVRGRKLCAYLLMVVSWFSFI